MRRAFMALILLALANICFAGQPSQAASSQVSDSRNQQVDEPPPVKSVHRPKLPLQEALKIAEGFINQQHIDIRPFWLYRAIFILEGDEKTPDQDKIPGWHFWWVNENGALGDYVEIFVDMNGRANRMPSM